MIYEDDYLGCPCGVEGLKALNDKLNAQVVERVNDTQQLVMMTGFAVETDEFQYKKCLQERISEIASWRWVLSDLNKRLTEAVSTLKYEHKALRVVIQRVQSEIEGFCREATRPGALCPLKDSVEDAIKQEFDFLRKQKARFEKIIPELERQTAAVERAKKKIEDDVHNKEQAIVVEEECAKINLETAIRIGSKKKMKKKCSPILRWEKRCKSLKDAGLRALSNAIVTRQQLRGARVELSIAAQAYAARVDSTLRRRLHANQAKIQELIWQRQEAVHDLQALDGELRTTEQNLIDNMEQERIVEARLADRMHRPPGELTKDDVDRKLRDELARLRRFNKDLRSNIERITSLQNQLSAAIAQIDCCGEDILQVVRLDEDRIRSRFGELPPSSNFPSFSSTDPCRCSTFTNITSSLPSQPVTSTPSPSVNSYYDNSASTSRNSPPSDLKTIKEENEEDDDYPFDD